MAISGFKLACKPGPCFQLRPPIPLQHCVAQLFRYGSGTALQAFCRGGVSDSPVAPSEHDSSSASTTGNADEAESAARKVKRPPWNKLSSEDLGITTSMIPRTTRKVLKRLKIKGYEVFLVGGCVRDLILNRIPKDFDIITSAELTEVVRTFSWCEIVGKRFPICHVHVEDNVVEVSSFSSCGKKFVRDLSDDYGRSDDCDEKDYLLWRNCLHRDFTINGMFFDPYANIVYDYIGGMDDIRKAKVRTVAPASESFREDSARILRAIRIAARLGFRLSKETAYFIKVLSYLVLKLDKGRLLMELNYMLAYGSAEASLRLLWKYGILELLLPFQAAYFVRQGFERRDKRSNMLLSLFSNLDKHLAPDQPCHSSLWVGILAFHKAVCDQPRHPLVVAAFSLAVNNGGDILEAVNIAMSIPRTHPTRFTELLEHQDIDPQALRNDVIDLAASIKDALSKMADGRYVSKAMAGYARAPYSNLVFISLPLHLDVGKIFQCVRAGPEKGFAPKLDGKINYELLALGNLTEVRHTFARVVFDTLYPLHRT